MTTPLVSVKMLAYNHKSYIAKAIESVLAQKVNFDYELLIGEDFSTDGTREIAFDYQRKYPNIVRVITSDENVGMQKNSLRLIKASRGKYIAHCEADDYWTCPDKLQKQIDVMEADPTITMCFHNVNFLYPDGRKPKIQFPYRFRDRFYSTGDVIIMGGEFYKVVSAVVRRSVFSDIPDWYHESPVGDWAISLLSALNGRMYYIKDTMAVYRSGVPQSWTEKMYSNPALYKKHLFQSMRTRKLADQFSRHQYQKFFGKRIAGDIRWLMVFSELTDDEFSELECEYFSLLPFFDRASILSMKAVRIGTLFTFLRKIKNGSEGT